MADGPAGNDPAEAAAAASRPSSAAAAAMMIDMNARRSIASDSFLSGQGSSRSVQQYDNKDTAFMLISRSGGSAAKKMLRTIQSKCRDREEDIVERQQQQRTSARAAATNDDENNNNNNNNNNAAAAAAAAAAAGARGGEQRQEEQQRQVQQPPPPRRECCILAQWTCDSYYQVVIAGNGGIETFLRAMRAFADDRAVQECCCVALGNLCWGSGDGASLLALERENGVERIVEAMRNHPRSVAVQSAACEALRNASSVVARLPPPLEGDTSANDDTDDTTSSSSLRSQLAEVLLHSKQILSNAEHKRIVDDLLSAMGSNAATA